MEGRVEDKRTARQRRVDLQRILKVIDSMLTEARLTTDGNRIATLEHLQLALLARRPFEPSFQP
jgi:hypothetical protein